MPILFINPIYARYWSYFFFSDTALQNKAKPVGGSAPQTFFSGTNKPTNTGAGMASLQPKRTPLSQDEIDIILVCIFHPDLKLIWAVY